MSRYHKTDAWRGYDIPDLAVAGSSYTGEWSDSPCPSSSVKPELKKFQSHLKKHGIGSKIQSGETSNVFNVKLWVVVSKEDFNKAGSLATSWLKKNESTIRYIHDADLPKGVKKLGKVV